MKENVSAHTRHVANSSGSLCYNCHMPHTTYGLLKGIRSHQIDSPNLKTSLATGRPNACNLCHLDKTLAWTQQNLSQWSGTENIDLTDEQKSVSAAILWILKGDAGQRAIAAWHLGWGPARLASGVEWMAPYISELLNDPYSAVRYIAARSLREFTEYRDFSYDYVANEDTRRQTANSLATLWQSTTKAKGNPDLLIESNGRIDRNRLSELLQQRDLKAIHLRE